MKYEIKSSHILEACGESFHIDDNVLIEYEGHFIEGYILSFDEKVLKLVEDKDGHDVISVFPLVKISNIRIY